MEFEDRWDAALGGMESAGLDLLIGVSGAVHSISRPDAVQLLSDVRPLGDSAVMLAGDGRSTLVVTPSWDAARAGRHTLTDETRGNDDLVAALAEVLRLAAVPAVRIGIAGLATLPHAMATRITALLDGEARNADALLAEVGRRKTASEMARARRATEIAERGFERLLEIARPGMAECDLAAALMADMKALGADSNFLMLSASPHNRAVQPSSARALEVGDVILGELTPSFQGQFAQICRSAVIGPPGDVLEEKYELLVGAMAAGIEAAIPGAPMAGVCQAIDAVLTEAGYGDYCHPPFIRRRGHGLGYSATVPGEVSVENTITLEEDMLFVVHPNQYLPETGYLLCGEPVAVTADGPHVLSASMASLGVIAV